MFAVAARHGVAAACVLAVSEAQGERLDADGIEAVEVELGRVGAAASNCGIEGGEAGCLCRSSRTRRGVACVTALEVQPEPLVAD